MIKITYEILLAEEIGGWELCEDLKTLVSRNLNFFTITISLSLVSTGHLNGAKIAYKLLAQMVIKILRLHLLCRQLLNLLIINNIYKNLDKTGYIFKVVRCRKW